MTSSIVLCENNNNFIFFNQNLILNPFISRGEPPSFVLRLGGKARRRFTRFVSKAEHSRRKKNSSSWWKRFFFEDDGNWLGLKEDDMVEAEEEDEEEEVSGDAKFEAWKQRAEAIVEVREAREDRRNEESRRWEDWLLDDGGNGSSSSWSEEWEQGIKDYREEKVLEDVAGEKGLVQSVRSYLFGREEDDDDMLYEDRVFQYASSNSAKFLAVLIIIPWAIDFVVHDYVLMPFLDRYVKTVPLAAQMLDVRRGQKLRIVDELKIERGRFQLEVEIGKSPPLSDDELWLELRHKALDLRDEWRLENRSAFANIWSDMVYGISLFILLYFNKNKVALLKFTGYKIINNISDTGKAFLVILITDIFLGYHSESGWQTLLEVIVEHYGLEIDQSAIVIFVCLIPVVIDACVKLWLFKFLPQLSPKVANIFQEMKRH
ncbi:chloroplast envelope membrane protein [Lotus japonicus]|uniref:chloroplast envelope membrane protein n=1 Tax=Lotus japonicus TaxID=34305 RepID=UPI0025896805|nr:chloroplast envelope membrane protein [Lotus japonicus]